MKALSLALTTLVLSPALIAQVATTTPFDLSGWNIEFDDRVGMTHVWKSTTTSSLGNSRYETAPKAFVAVASNTPPTPAICRRGRFLR